MKSFVRDPAIYASIIIAMVFIVGAAAGFFYRDKACMTDSKIAEFFREQQ